MKVFLGGGESSHVAGVLTSREAPYVALSYIEMRKKSERATLELLNHYKETETTLLLTSGSKGTLRKYAWMDIRTLSIKHDPEFADVRKSLNDRGVDIPKLVKSTVEQLTQQGQEYIDFGVKYKSYFRYIVEFDVPEIVGYDVVAEWRRTWLDKGVDPIIVYHGKWVASEHIKQVYLESDHEHIGLTYTNVDECQEVINAFDGAFKKRGKKFVGIGVTHQKIIQSVPYFMVYSSSWLSGAKYGAVFDEISPGKLSRIVDSNLPKDACDEVLDKLKVEVEALGIDFLDFRNLEYKALNEWNCVKWVDVVEALDCIEYTDYWVSPEEKRANAIALAESTPVVAVHTREKASNVHSDRRLTLKRHCDRCSFAQTGCSVYVPGSTCGLATQYDIRNGEDVLEAFGSIVSAQLDRVSFAMAMEKMQGLGISPEVSDEVERTTRIMKDYRQAEKTMVSERVAHVGPTGISFIERLFSRPSSSSGSQSQLARADNEAKRAEIRAQIASSSNKDPEDVIDVEFQED